MSHVPFPPNEIVKLGKISPIVWVAIIVYLCAFATACVVIVVRA